MVLHACSLTSDDNGQRTSANTIENLLGLPGTENSCLRGTSQKLAVRMMLIVCGSGLSTSSAFCGELKCNTFEVDDLPIY